MADLNDDHDLEMHIQDLRRLDNYRKESARLRDKGFDTLRDKNQYQEPSSVEGLFEGPTRPNYIKICNYFNLIKTFQLNSKETSEQVWQNLPIELINRCLTIENIDKYTLSVVLAAKTIQMLTKVPGATFSKPVLLCWYWIIREIFTSESPDWSIGGARAGDNGISNAYTTAECVASLQIFAESHENTGKFFEKLDDIKKRLEELNDEDIPKQWRDKEKEQILFNSKVELSQYRQYLSLSIDEDETPARDINHENINNYLEKITEKLPTAIAKLCGNFDEAKKEIELFRETERNNVYPQNVEGGESETPEGRSTRQRDNHENSEQEDKEQERLKRKFIRSETAHSMAMNIFDEAKNLADQTEKNISENNNNWELLKDNFIKASQRIRLALYSPVKQFLSSVIDRELSIASLGDNQGWEPVELIFSATAYSLIIDKPEEDERLRSVVPLLYKVISSLGQFPMGKPYHKSKDNYHYWVDNTNILNSYAKLIQRTNYPVKLEIVKYILRYFEETRVNAGWRSMFAPESRQLDVDITADAVQALASINRMLDEHINNIVLEHFSVKQPQDIKLPTLDRLFYPDHGLNLAPKGIRNVSISEALYRMRLHITRVGLKNEVQNNLYSLILYGPPGTGKTTFIESLALTCKVPLVEVTPSDIIKGGEALAEHRARIVFEALSLLTRVVILFDEFDPVLKRRNPDAKDLNVFSFLTPGMLPKLKNLHEKAKDRSVAFVLATNLIGTLDEAAIRPGRFDERLGIFPPDLLSRTGRFISEAKRAGKPVKTDSSTLKKIMIETAGAGMSGLTRKGWFIGSKDMKENTPLYQILQDSPSESDIDFTGCKPEELLCFKGQGQAAKQEYLEWAWVKLWDDKLQDAKTSLADSLNNLPCSEALKKQIDSIKDKIIQKDKDFDFKGWKKEIESIYSVQKTAP